MINFISFSVDGWAKGHCNFWVISLQTLDSVIAILIWSCLLAIDFLFRSHFGPVNGKECNLLDVVERVFYFSQTKKRQILVF